MNRPAPEGLYGAANPIKHEIMNGIKPLVEQPNSAEVIRPFTIEAKSSQKQAPQERPPKPVEDLDQN